MTSSFRARERKTIRPKIEFCLLHPEEVADTVKRGRGLSLHTWSRERLSLLNSISELL